MVTGNTFRHPALLAKMAATVDHIAHGRLDVGIGAGWMPEEHAMYGIALPVRAARIQQLDEAREVMRRLWTEESRTGALIGQLSLPSPERLVIFAADRLALATSRHLGGYARMGARMAARRAGTCRPH